MKRPVQHRVPGNYANINLIPEVKRVNGVGDAMVLGQDYSMRIWLKPDVMAQYKLIPNDVVAALSEQNIEAAPGQLGERGNQTYQYTLRYKGRLQQTTEFENIVIKALENGEILRLKDVANVELGRLSYGFNNMVNGHKAVSCIISRWQAVMPRRPSRISRPYWTTIPANCPPA